MPQLLKKKISLKLWFCSQYFINKIINFLSSNLANLKGYASFFSSIASVLSMMLGKYNFDEFFEADILLGPIYFVGFNVLGNWIVLNMFITILNDSFAVIRSNELKGCDDEVFDFIISRIKSKLLDKNQFNSDVIIFGTFQNF